MSDQTNAGDAGDFRGSAADKRKDETVMVNADDLSNLVSNAREEPAAPAAPATPAPDQTFDNGKQVVIVAAVLGVIAVIVVIVLLVNLASG